MGYARSMNYIYAGRDSDYGFAFGHIFAAYQCAIGCEDAHFGGSRTVKHNAFYAGGYCNAGNGYVFYSGSLFVVYLVAVDDGVFLFAWIEC